MHTNTKYWSFTWQTNVKQRKLPEENKLLNFLNGICDECIFQYEKGSLKGKEHIHNI